MNLLTVAVVATPAIVMGALSVRSKWVEQNYPWLIAGGAMAMLLLAYALS